MSRHERVPKSSIFPAAFGPFVLLSCPLFSTPTRSPYSPCTCHPPYAPLSVCRERHRYQWQQVRPTTARCFCRPRQFSTARLIPSAVISLHVYMRSLFFFWKAHLPPSPRRCMSAPAFASPPPCLATVINVATRRLASFPSTHLNVNSVSRTTVCDNQDPAKLYGVQTGVLNSY